MTHPTVPVLVVVVVAAAAAAAVLTTTTLSLKNNSTWRWVSKHVSESYEFYCCRYKCLPRVCHSPTFAAVDRASRQALSMFSSAAKSSLWKPINNNNKPMYVGRTNSALHEIERRRTETQNVLEFARRQLSQMLTSVVGLLQRMQKCMLLLLSQRCTW